MTPSFVALSKSIIATSGREDHASCDAVGVLSRHPEVAMPNNGQAGVRAAIAEVTAPPIECPMRTTPRAPAPYRVQISPIISSRIVALFNTVASAGGKAV